MSDPLAFFIAPRNAQPLPVGTVDSKQLAQWAAETELGTASGGAQRGGKFSVLASVSADQQAALRDYDTLRRAGFPAVIQPVKSAEYRVRIVDLPSQNDAQAMVEKLKALGMARSRNRKVTAPSPRRIRLRLALPLRAVGGWNETSCCRARLIREN